MKKYIKFTFVGLGLLSLSSCINTLDTKPTQSFESEVIWGNKVSTEGFINKTYDEVLRDGWVQCVDWEARTPNSAQCSQVGEGIDNVATEAGLDRNNDWGINRFGILRRANMILTNVAASGSLNEEEKKELMAHGYLIRGMIFFNQARKMGRIVPVTQVFSSTDEEAVKIPLTESPAESYKYIIDDFKKAIEGLPAINDPGLPTKWAAGVLLSRAALQAYAYTNDKSYLDICINAANEVINNSGIKLSTSQGMFNETDLYNSEILWGFYREKENTKIGDYAELIRTYPNISNDDVRMTGGSQFLCPQGRTFEGWAIYFPTQDLVDQFLVTDEKTGNALPWYETSQYLDNVNVLDPSSITEPGQVDKLTRTNKEVRNMPSKQDFLQLNKNFPTFLRYAKLKEGVKKDISDIMYENRDKRFYTAVIYDKCSWVGEKIELNFGGNSYRGVRDREDGGWYNTTTGYYWRKSNIENPSPRAFFDCRVALHYNICRLGEAYLNLAEAYLCKGEVAKAVEAMNNTRTVHGGIAPSKAASLEQAWADYIRERNCELTNESGDIYFSYLRWGKYGGDANHGRKPGDIIYDLDKPVYQIQINKERNTILVNQLTLLNSASRQFTEKRYLFPINQGWLDTRAIYNINDGKNGGQNEGW